MERARVADAGIVNVFVTVVARPCASVLVSTSVDVTLAVPAEVCSVDRVRVMEEGMVKVFVMVVAFPWASVVVSTSVDTALASAVPAVDEERAVRVRPPPEIVQVFVMVVALPLPSEVIMVCTSSAVLLVKVCVMVMVRPLTTEVSVVVAQAPRVIDAGTVNVRVMVLPEASVVVSTLVLALLLPCSSGAAVAVLDSRENVRVYVVPSCVIVATVCVGRLVAVIPLPVCPPSAPEQLIPERRHRFAGWRMLIWRRRASADMVYAW